MSHRPGPAAERQMKLRTVRSWVIGETGSEVGRELQREHR